METVKRKINALKDEIERKDEGKISHPNFPLLGFPPKSYSCFPMGSFAPEPNFIFLDITVLREKLKKEQMERERYENEANHQSRKVQILRVTAPILF